MKTWTSRLGWFHTRAAKTLVEQLADENNLCPNYDEIFRPLICTPFDKVKVVLMAETPYIGKFQADGLAWSCRNWTEKLNDVVMPITLRNIFNEYHLDTGFHSPRSGDLTPWAKQGVLLFNEIWTCRAGERLAHKGLGWEELSQDILIHLNRDNKKKVFIFWGDRMQGLGRAFIDPKKHTVIEGPQPYPAPKKTFLNNKPFQKTNAALVGDGQEPIHWKIM